MGRRKRKIIEQVEVTDLVAEGKGLARKDGKVIFVENAIPGDVVDVRVKRKKKDYAIGVVQEVHKLSDDRVEPICEHFGICGGCKWQYLPYDKQLTYKQKIVEDVFRRTGKMEVEVSPILGSASTEYYRNKMEFTFSACRWVTEEEVQSGEEITDRNGLGLYVAGFYNRIVDLQHCHLQGGATNEIRNELRAFATEQQLSFYNQDSSEGFMRGVIVRYTSLNELMVMVIFGKGAEEDRTKVLDFLLSKFPQITSLNYIVNEKLNDFVGDLEVINYAGRAYILEELGGLQFKISPKSFFQTNSKQAEVLYGVVKDLAALKGNELVFDLYTGTGSIALFLANQCKKIVGVEEVEDAIIDAQFNTELNKIENSHFVVGDVKEALHGGLIEEHGLPDVVIFDPPRAGLHAEVVDSILQAAPERIVYVSCNPVTQARDVALMAEQYEIVKVQPVDMFPHTYHIENVILLKRKQ